MSGFQFKGKDESTREDELKQRLQKEKEQEKDKNQKKEKILIILDDIWKKLIWRKLEFLSKMIRQYANYCWFLETQTYYAKTWAHKNVFQFNLYKEKKLGIYSRT